MQIGAELTRVEIGDVTLWVELTWGQLKALQSAVAKIDETRPESMGPVEEQIRGLIKRVEGLERPDGTAIAEITPEIWDQLPASFVLTCVRRLLEIGTGARDDTFRAGAEL